MSIRDNTKAVAFGKESDEQRSKSFEELEKATGKFIRIIHKFTKADVKGGVSIYISLFFDKDCIHHLNSNNSQFLDLLQIFIYLQWLIDTMRNCLGEIE